MSAVRPKDRNCLMKSKGFFSVVGKECGRVLSCFSDFWAWQGASYPAVDRQPHWSGGLQLTTLRLRCSGHGLASLHQPHCAGCQDTFHFGSKQTDQGVAFAPWQLPKYMALASKMKFFSLFCFVFHLVVKCVLFIALLFSASLEML